MSRPLNMPFEEWPLADQRMWELLLRPGNPLDERGALSHIKPATRKSLQLHYGRWLEWLNRTRPPVLALLPSARATPEHLWDWLQSLAHTSPHSQEMLIHATLRVLKAAAPDLDWSRQMQLGKSLRRRASQSITDRKEGRVLDSAVLFRAGVDLAGPPSQDAQMSLAEAKRFRDGTMLAFLAILPIRRRAFGSLKLGQSVVATEACIHIFLSGDMTKNGRPWEAPVPDALSPTLAHYIDQVRPFFLGRSDTVHEDLWLSDRGKPYALNYLGTRMADITERQLGLRIYPHLFRDAAATSLSRHSPESARLIRHGVAERHYVRAQGIEAGRAYAAMLDNLLDEEA